MSAVSPLDQRSRNPGFVISPMRVFDRALRYWYIIILSVIAGVIGGWLVTRYTTRIYPATASLIVRESEENMAARSLYSNAILTRRNYFNEFYIMRSLPIMQGVVEDLGLDVTFIRLGDIRSTEVFEAGFPFKVLPASGSSLPYGRVLSFTILSADEYMLGTEDEAGQILKETRYRYADTVKLGDNRFYIKREPASGSDLAGKEFQIRFTNPAQLAAEYSGGLNLAWSQQGAGVIDIYMQGPVPARMEAFLQRFITRYQEYDIERKSLMAVKSIDFLDRQIDIISDSLRFYENQISTLAVKGIDGSASQLQRLSLMYTSIDDADLKIRLQERYYSYLENYLNTRSDFSQVLLPASLGVSDPVLSGLVTKLADLQFQLKLLQGQSESNANPLVQESREKIALYKKDIEEGIRSAQEIMSINRGMQSDRLKEMEKAVADQPGPNRELAGLNRNYKLNEGLYNLLIQKRAESAISQASTTSDIAVLNYPKAGDAISPLPMQNYLTGLLAGLLFPIVLFVLMEALDNKVQSKEDIELFSSVPVIGTIGHSGTKGTLAVQDNPRSYLAESFRALRSNLNYFTDSNPGKILLVTSSISGEGKSFTSVNVATVLAFTGKKTILVGGDMRKTKLSREFGVSNAKGLSTVLTVQSELDPAIFPTRVEHLDFMPSGPVPPNPAELFLKPATADLLKALLKKYDYVVVDSPPVGMVSDALSLIPIVDHILFVVRQNYTPLTAITQLQTLVEQGEVKHISIVFNDILKFGRGYGYKYGYAYDYGYGYGSKYGQGGYYDEDKPKKDSETEGHS